MPSTRAPPFLPLRRNPSSTSGSKFREALAPDISGRLSAARLRKFGYQGGDYNRLADYYIVRQATKDDNGGDFFLNDDLSKKFLRSDAHQLLSLAASNRLTQSCTIPFDIYSKIIRANFTTVKSSLRLTMVAGYLREHNYLGIATLLAQSIAVMAGVPKL